MSSLHSRTVVHCIGLDWGAFRRMGSQQSCKSVFMSLNDSRRYIASSGSANIVPTGHLNIASSVIVAWNCRTNHQWMHFSSSTSLNTQNRKYSSLKNQGRKSYSTNSFENNPRDRKAPRNKWSKKRGKLHPSLQEHSNDQNAHQVEGRRNIDRSDISPSAWGKNSEDRIGSYLKNEHVTNHSEQNSTNDTVQSPSARSDRHTKYLHIAGQAETSKTMNDDQTDTSTFSERNIKASKRTGTSFYLKGLLPETQNGKPPRISAYIAQLGIASRREAGEWIKEGRVTYKGSPLTDLSFRVKDTDKLFLKGYGEISPKIAMDTLRPRLWIARKPREVICSRKDENGRTTLLEVLQRQGFPNHISWVGRLDYMSEGLILLTNDGHLKRYLEDPSNKFKRTYLVRAHGHISEHQIQSIERGSMVEGIKYGKMEISIRSVDADKTSSWLEMTLEEGKNREIRRVLDHLGLQVTRLIRIRFGPFELPRRLSIGQVKEVSIPSDMLHMTTYGNHDIPESL